VATFIRINLFAKRCRSSTDALRSEFGMHAWAAIGSATVRKDGSDLGSQGFYPHTFLVYTYGKTLLTPGQRLGYIALPPTMPDREQLRTALFVSQLLPRSPLVDDEAFIELLADKNIFCLPGTVEQFDRQRKSQAPPRKQ
jgi:hypothetical protein